MLPNNDQEVVPFKCILFSNPVYSSFEDCNFFEVDFSFCLFTSHNKTHDIADTFHIGFETKDNDLKRFFAYHV